MSVTATINYVTSEDKFVPPEPLFSYTYAPPAGRPQTNERYDPRSVEIRDIRQHPELPFEQVGFKVLNSPTSIPETEFESFSSNTDQFEPMNTDQSFLKAYHEEIERKVIPGVTRVITYNQKTRLLTPKTPVEGYDFSSVVNYPVLRPHIDLVPESAGELVEPYIAQAKRVLIVNAWRPIRGTVLDAPLAVADPTTVTPESKIYNRVLYRDREKGMYMIRDPRKAIQWYYLSAQTPDEVLLFKQYDSERPDDIPPHSAFVDERYEGKEEVIPRHSIETRSLVLIE